MKVVCKESVLVPALELFDGGEACLEDIVVDGGEVALAELELAGTDCEEVGCYGLAALMHDLCKILRRVFEGDEGVFIDNKDD